MFPTLVFILLMQVTVPANAVDNSADNTGHKTSSASAKTGATPQPKQPDARPGTGRYHVVKPGETLYRIGVNTGIGHKKLAEWNGLPPDYLVKSGQTLRLFPRDSEAEANKEPKKAQPVKAENAAEKNARSAPVTAAGSIKTKPLGDGIKVTPLPNPSGLDKQRADKKASKAQNSNSITANKPVGNMTPLSSEKNKNTQTVANKTVNGTGSNGKLGTTKKPEVEPKKPMATTTKKSMLKSGFQWPLHGVVLKRHSGAKAYAIGIASRMDKQAVKAAAAGKVLYQGRGLENYLNLIVIKHSDDFLTVYANNSRILVKDGENIHKGQAIAEISAASGKQKPLHFEIRKAGRPIDPLSVLPPR